MHAQRPVSTQHIVDSVDCIDCILNHQPPQAGGKLDLQDGNVQPEAKRRDLPVDRR